MFNGYFWLSHSFALTVYIAAALWPEMTCILKNVMRIIYTDVNNSKHVKYVNLHFVL